MNRSFIVIFTILMIMFPISAIDYYGDFVIDVKENGEVSIKGDTNHENFQDIAKSQKFTKKNEEQWILNISSPEHFEYYIYEIHLPKGTEIDYIEDKSRVKVFKRDQLIVLGENSDDPLNIIVKYRLGESGEETYFLLGFILLVILFTSSWFYCKRKKKTESDNTKKEKQPIKEEPKVEEKDEDDSIKKIDISIYPQRQQDIMSIVEEKEKISQKQLEDIMEIPSSSTSRNVKALELKGILGKEKIGQTNYLYLKVKIKK